MLATPPSADLSPLNITRLPDPYRDVSSLHLQVSAIKTRVLTAANIPT